MLSFVWVTKIEFVNYFIFIFSHFSTFIKQNKNNDTSTRRGEIQIVKIRIAEMFENSTSKCQDEHHIWMLTLNHKLDYLLPTNIEKLQMMVSS